MHRDFKRYVKETGGFEDGYELLKPLGLALSPSGVIVKRSSLYTKKENIRGRYQKRHEDNEQNKIQEVNDTVGVQSEFNYAGPEQMVDLVSKLDLSKQFLVTIVDDQDKQINYTLNEKTYGRLSAILNPAVEQESTASDSEIIVLLKSYKYFKVKQIEPSKKHQGGFFKYTLKVPLENVSKYGLFTEVSPKNYEDSCFIEALKHSGQVSNDLLYKIKLSIKCRFLPMCKIKTICESHNLRIKIEGVDTTRKTIEFGDKKLPVIRIGLIDQHYFIIDKTQYTSYSIKNYESLKDKPRWNEFIKKKERSSKRFISSLDLFRLLTKDEEVKDTFLQHIELGQALYKTQFFEQFSDISQLSLGEGDFRPTMSSDDLAEKTEKKQKWQANTTRIFFDFETNVYTGGRHIPYLGFYSTEDGESFGFYGMDCAKQMLEHLHKKFYDDQTELLMIAHNAGYDWTTGIGQHLYKVKTIEKGSSLMFASGSYYRFGNELKITVHDSYAKIPVGLSKFGGMFALDQQKEVMPYPIYNTHNIKKGSAPMSECLSHLPKADHSHFKANCEKWDCIRPDSDTVDIIKYSAKYCEMDCIVLRRGYQAFEEMIREITGLEVDHFISIASLADSYLIKEGCYEDVYDLGGVCRQFVQKCLVGGRTMLCQNTQQRESNCQMDDFDAVSLYPSAMARLSGYLKGAPKLIATTDYEKLKATSSGFYVRAKVLKVGIKRDFPLLSKINEKGIREFTNDLQDEVVYIDNVSMEDAMQFQQCEFEIIDGYMFNEGFNPKIKESIQHLFNSRLEAKKVKNPVQGIIKLIMNSCYGKCALKEIADDTVYIQDSKFEQFISRHYNWIKESTVSHDGKSHRVTKVKPINSHFNRVHIGIQVLSMSKRIMNEVMCLSEDIGQRIYYQDTDSMHIMRQDVGPLAVAFKQKYGRELIGKQLGQFHGDFDLDGCSNVYSENFIALGKKSYIDCIVGKCDKTGELKRDVHIRMKGVPNSAILGECRKRKCSPLQIYELLQSGEAVEFDLLKGEQGEARVRFKKTKSSTMTTVQSFKRKVQFRK